MNCLLIFDHLNDIIFTKFNKKFEEHIKNFATAQGLLVEVLKTGNYKFNRIIMFVF